MSIAKVAQLFQKKLAQTAAKTAEDLRKIMGYASSLAAKYDYTEAGYDLAQSLASKSYQLWMAAKAPNSKLTAAQVKSQLAGLSSLVNQVNGMTRDTNSKKTLNMLSSLINSTQPADLGIAAPVAKPAPEKLSPELEDVVKQQAPKPLPWEYQYSPPEEQFKLNTPSPAPEKPKTTTPANYTPAYPTSQEDEEALSSGRAEIENPPPGWRYIPKKL